MRTGRPTTPAMEGGKATLGIVAPAAEKNELDQSAKQNGRTLSQEALHRIRKYGRDELTAPLELAFGRPIAVLLLILGRVMRDTAIEVAATTQLLPTIEALRQHVALGVENWPDDAYSYAQVANAAIEALQAMRPEGHTGVPEGARALQAAFRATAEQKGWDTNSPALAESYYSEVGNRIAAEYVSLLRDPPAAGSELGDWLHSMRGLIPAIVARIPEKYAEAGDKARWLLAHRAAGDQAERDPASVSTER